MGETLTANMDDIHQRVQRDLEALRDDHVDVLEYRVELADLARGLRSELGAHVCPCGTGIGNLDSGWIEDEDGDEFLILNVECFNGHAYRVIIDQ